MQLTDGQQMALKAVEVEILRSFIHACDALGLRYYVIGGTLLGAVRHQGFIPWDDDIDVGMTRDNYNRLLNLSADVFGSELFLQNTYTDKIVRNHSQIRMKGTTCFVKGDYLEKYKMGIFIDIFVFDAIPSTKQDYKKELEQIKKEYLYLRPRFYSSNLKYSAFVLFCYNTMVKIYNNVFHKMKCALRGGKSNAFRKLEKKISDYAKDSEYIASAEYAIFNKNPFMFLRKDFENIIYLPFEDFMIPCPINYENVLRTQFGNYNEFLVGKSEHGQIYFNCDEEIKYPINPKKFNQLFDDFNF